MPNTDGELFVFFFTESLESKLVSVSIFASTAESGFEPVCWTTLEGWSAADDGVSIGNKGVGPAAAIWVARAGVTLIVDVRIRGCL